MKKIRRSKWVGVWVLAGLAILGLAITPIPAQAIVIIDFRDGSAPPGGSVTLVGGNYVGMDIPIDIVVADGTGADGSYDVDGLLGGGLYADLDFDTGNAGNYFTISGSVPGLSVGQTTLLSGTVSSFSASTLGGQLLFSAGGPDIKDSGLLTALGLPTTTVFNYAAFNISADWNGTTGRVNSTDVSNKAPEPGTLLLVGMGLVGLGYLGRRKNA